MMNRDSDALETYLFRWLLQDLEPSTATQPEEEAMGGLDSAGGDRASFSSPQGSVVYHEATELTTDRFDPLDSELEGVGVNPNGVNPLPLATDSLSNQANGATPISSSWPKGGQVQSTASPESFHRSSGYPPLTTRGIPVVQDRFHALLKRRLKLEIQRHPPLFPWEMTVMDYEPDKELVQTDSLRDRILAHAWAEQLKRLKLPVPMAQATLLQLFDRCQEAAQTSLKTGAKLVRAVEGLFPGQFLKLNQLAELVLMTPSRSPSAMLGGNLPDSFESAIPTQQMALSLMVANELLNLLMLNIPANQPIVERQWQASSGMLTIQVSYLDRGEGGHLHIRAELPEGGSLRVQGQETCSTAERTTAGLLYVDLYGVEAGHAYPLTVSLTASEQVPLIFSLCPIAA